MSISACDFVRPIVVLPNRKAVVRALAAGRTVWCAETGEGFQMAACSLNRARHIARYIFAEEERKNFFFGSGAK